MMLFCVFDKSVIITFLVIICVYHTVHSFHCSSSHSFPYFFFRLPVFVSPSTLLPQPNSQKKCFVKIWGGGSCNKSFFYCNTWFKSYFLHMQPFGHHSMIADNQGTHCNTIIKRTYRQFK